MFVVPKTEQPKVGQGTGSSEEAEKQLHALGAPPREPSESPAQWLPRVLPGIGARQLRHQGNHRYLFPLNRRVRVHLPVLPYPIR